MRVRAEFKLNFGVAQDIAYHCGKPVLWHILILVGKISVFIRKIYGYAVHYFFTQVFGLKAPLFHSVDVKNILINEVRKTPYFPTLMVFKLQNRHFLIDTYLVNKRLFNSFRLFF